MAVNWPGQSATVFVSFALTGGMPNATSAGKEKNEPPPATALSAPAQKAAAANIQYLLSKKETCKEEIASGNFAVYRALHGHTIEIGFAGPVSIARK